MTETKYGKFVIDAVRKTRLGQGVQLHREELGTDCIIAYNCISKPIYMHQEPHAHDFQQFLGFIGGNPMNLHEFGAEIELSLGEEGEKHIIDKTTIVSIPPGLIHCPLNFKTVDKPIVFLEIMLTSAYKRATPS